MTAYFLAIKVISELAINVRDTSIGKVYTDLIKSAKVQTLGAVNAKMPVMSPRNCAVTLHSYWAAAGPHPLSHLAWPARLCSYSVTAYLDYGWVGRITPSAHFV